MIRVPARDARCCPKGRLNWEAAVAGEVVVCPRCGGDGEEPGAPVSLDEVWLCSLCDGKGAVPPEKAAAFSEEDEGDEGPDLGTKSERES
jgi:DnaJ-class molecular chaperone